METRGQCAAREAPERRIGLDGNGAAPGTLEPFRLHVLWPDKIHAPGEGRIKVDNDAHDLVSSHAPNRNKTRTNREFVKQD
jgi:hypothetical protein